MNRSVTALAILTASVVAVPGLAQAGEPGDGEVLALVQRHCLSCHAAQPAHPAFREAPKGVVLESLADVKKHARAIEQQTVETKAMPLGNETGMTQEERAVLGRWLKAVE